uniref:GDSL esterase/lipase n=1 Tax=Leersia perrieri TaxID=77586 RepID=A0A0D9XYE7_9ORYZ
MAPSSPAFVSPAMASAAAQKQKQMVPCMYIFGDSLVDSGNNNNIMSLARANYRPYGVDFAGGAPPGRFTNGLTVVDFLADMLGFRPPLIPAYAMAQPGDFARGLNFASGAAGIRAETGNNLGRHYPLSEQVEHFQAALRQMGPNATTPERLGRCIFYVGMGSNDYLNNYFMPNYYTTSQSYDPAAYAAGLLSMVKKFNRGGGGKMAGAKFVYLDTVRTGRWLAANAGGNGFTVLDRGCCGVGRNNGQITCLPMQQPCDDRSKYVFWDAFHPTEAANRIYAARQFNSSSASGDAYPMSISQLAAL